MIFVFVFVSVVVIIIVPYVCSHSHYYHHHNTVIGFDGDENYENIRKMLSLDIVDHDDDGSPSCDVMWCDRWIDRFVVDHLIINDDVDVVQKKKQC